MSDSSNSSSQCQAGPPAFKDFQSSLSDLMDKAGASDTCKTKASEMFDSANTSSGSNLQSGKSSTSQKTYTNTSVDGTSATAYANAGWGAVDTGLTVTTTKSDTQAGGQSATSTEQLNLTQQQAEAMSKGAKEMSSEGCGTLMMNAQKLAHYKQQMNCIIQKSLKSTTVTASATANITIEQIPFDILGCMKQTESIKDDKIKGEVMKVCAKISEQQAKGEMVFENVQIKQKAAVQVKSKIELSEQSKQQLADIQTKMADAIVDAKLTSDNKLDALPQSVKDIKTSDTTISDSCSSTMINEKVETTKLEGIAGGNIHIKSVGNLTLKNVVFDQDVFATVISDMLSNDAISAGIEAADNISSTYRSKTGTDLSSLGSDLSKTAEVLGEANTDAIEAGQKAVNTATENQQAVDVTKLGAATAEANKSNADVINEQGEANKAIVKQSGDNAIGLNEQQGETVAAQIDAAQSIFPKELLIVVGIIAFIIIVVIGYLLYNKYFKKSSATGNQAG
jgi:hypothetical protein